MIGARAEAIGYVIVILSFTFALPSAAADTAKCIGKPTMAEYQACVDQEEGVMVGKYFCVIDNIAGLQDIEKVGRQPFFKIDPKDSKFFMEIARDDSLPCSSMGTQFYLINDQACRTRYRLTAKSELVPTPGYSLTMPQDFHSPRGDFVIEGGGKFWANYRFRSHYVFEGKCEKIN